ncbi:hypothetical protein [Nocardia sp. MW-W600-9]
MLTTSFVAVALSAGLTLAPAQAAPVVLAPVADTQTGSASGSAQMLLAWPLGFVLFGACFADGDSTTHNPLCQALLDLTAGSTDF